MVRPWRDATGPLVRMPNAERPLGFRRGVRRGEMMERVVRRLMCSLATLATLVLVAAACSDDGGSSSTKVVSIGVLAPIDGGLTDFGRGIRNSVELAVREANAAKAVPGWTISVNAVDDSSDPKKAVTAVVGLVADKNVAAVVGPYNSGVAVAVLPALSKANLALLSPSNTLTSLTLGDNAASSNRPYPNYFRLVGSDASQCEFLAAQAIKLGYKKAAVVSETKAVSKGLADVFATAYEAAGGTVTLQQTVPDGATDFAGFITAASATSPDVVFFGGEYIVAAALRTQSAGKLHVPLMGGDGMKDAAFISEAGAAATGSLASSVGFPAQMMAGAPAFAKAYSDAKFAEPPSDYGIYAYDAAKAIIRTLPASLKGATTPEAARAAVVKALGGITFDGASGSVAFDTFGDPKTAPFTLYKVTGTDWVAQ